MELLPLVRGWEGEGVHRTYKHHETVNEWRRSRSNPILRPLFLASANKGCSWCESASSLYTKQQKSVFLSSIDTHLERAYFNLHCVCPSVCKNFIALFQTLDNMYEI